MKQLTLATSGFEKYSKTTRRAIFLNEMDRVVPWSKLCTLIEPYYPTAGNGRPPVGLQRMLRVYCSKPTDWGMRCLARSIRTCNRSG